MDSRVMAYAGVNPIQYAIGACDSALGVKRADQYEEMTWINGGGVTKQLYVCPPGSKLAPKEGEVSALWRVSMAPVIKNGPFSVMPAYRRIITVAEGNGFRLKTKRNGTENLIYPGILHEFSGADEIDCELENGPCVDLNVMFRPEAVNANLRLFSGGSAARSILTLDPDEILMLICLNGEGEATFLDHRTQRLSKHESLFYFRKITNPILLNLTRGSRFAAIRIKATQESRQG